MQACFLCPTQTYHIDHWTDRLCSCGYHLSNYLFQYFTDVLTAPRPMHQNIRMVISTSKRGGLHRSLTIFTGIGLFCSLLKTWGLFSTQPLVTNQPFVSFSNCYTFIFKQFLSNSNSLPLTAPRTPYYFPMTAVIAAPLSACSAAVYLRWPRCGVGRCPTPGPAPCCLPSTKPAAGHD